MNVLPLFEKFPDISTQIPHTQLGQFPTPVDRADALAQKFGIGALFIKRDDLSGSEYGGNKVRKLEFTLAEAVRRGAKRVITFGAAGSNHALATAVYARELGLGCTSLLMPQTNSPGLRRNLLAGYRAGAELLLYPAGTDLNDVAGTLSLRYTEEDGTPPLIIPPGGSSPLGTVGFVNAALELEKQVHSGLLPCPDLIYLAWGTMGTATGLAIGLQAAGLPTRIVCVRVVPEFVGNETLFWRLLDQTKQTLRLIDSNSDFPLEFRHDQYGTGYAYPTKPAEEAIEAVKSGTGLTIEGTYTGKAFAALLADAREGRLKDKNVLFWNTYNSRSLDVSDSDYRKLPKALHSYFEREAPSLSDS